MDHTAGLEVCHPVKSQGTTTIMVPGATTAKAALPRTARDLRTPRSWPQAAASARALPGRERLRHGSTHRGITPARDPAFEGTVPASWGMMFWGTSLRSDIELIAVNYAFN